MEKRKVVVVLANGFEEIEAVCPIDILRRAGFDVVVACVPECSEDDCKGEPLSLVVRGSHGIAVECDCMVSNVDAKQFCAVVLPGGMPGAVNLHQCQAVSDLVLSINGAGGYVCAICASPAVVLAPLGVLDGRKAVCYPGMDECAPDVDFIKDVQVMVDGNVVTAAGPGCAAGFAFAIVQALCGRGEVDSLKESMVWV